MSLSECIYGRPSPLTLTVTRNGFQIVPCVTEVWGPFRCLFSRRVSLPPLQFSLVTRTDPMRHHSGGFLAGVTLKDQETLSNSRFDPKSPSAWRFAGRFAHAESALREVKAVTVSLSARKKND